MSKTAIILGATGLTGSHLLNLLCESNSYSKVTIFVRNKSGVTHPKLEEVVCDLLDLEKQREHFIADEVFCCIGTTKSKTPDRKLYYEIDYGIPMNAAKLAAQNKIKSFSVISAIGANTKSIFFYSRTKGKMEEDILQLGIPNIFIYKPSLISGKRKDNRLLEKLGIYLFNFLELFLVGRLRNYRSIKAEKLAQAMYWGAQYHKGHQTIYKEQFINKK